MSPTAAAEPKVWTCYRCPNTHFPTKGALDAHRRSLHQTITTAKTPSGHGTSFLFPHFQAVLRLWDEFGDHRWDHLIESMPVRIQAVIEAKGGSISY